MVRTKTLAFVNNKGGSGKTTTCANVAYSLTLMGRKCLLVDGDMQLNLSLSFLEEERVLELAGGVQNLYEAIKSGGNLQDCVVHTPYEHLDLIPSSTLMSGIEYGLATNWGKGFPTEGKHQTTEEDGTAAQDRRVKEVRAAEERKIIQGQTAQDREAVQDRTAQELEAVQDRTAQDREAVLDQTAQELEAVQDQIAQEGKTAQEWKSIEKQVNGRYDTAGENSRMYETAAGIYGNMDLLKGALRPIRDSGVYDYILIDAPPTLGGWVTNILAASDACILPVEASPWGLFGVANMLEFLEQTKRRAPFLSLLGVVVTKVDTRKSYGRQTIDILQQFDEVSVFDQIIHVDSAVEWAQDNSKPIYAYKKSTRSAGEYLELAKEVERRARRSK